MERRGKDELALVGRAESALPVAEPLWLRQMLWLLLLLLLLLRVLQMICTLLLLLLMMLLLVQLVLAAHALLIRVLDAHGHALLQTAAAPRPARRARRPSPQRRVLIHARHAQRAKLIRGSCTVLPALALRRCHATRLGRHQQRRRSRHRSATAETHAGGRKAQAAQLGWGQARSSERRALDGRQAAGRFAELGEDVVCVFVLR